jgi:hypothetical protein
MIPKEVWARLFQSTPHLSALEFADRIQRDAWEQGVSDGLAVRGGAREFPPVFPGDKVKP